MVFLGAVLLADSVWAMAPFSATRPAGPINASSATLNGMATPNGLDSTAWFEWGIRGSFGRTTGPVTVGSGTNVVRVSTPVSGLTVGGIYNCRLVVSNADGVVHGARQFFTTGQRVAQWGGQTNPPASLSNVVAVAGGGTHYLAVKNDGTVAAWGSNTYGESSVPGDLTNAMAVSCGSRHSAALKSDGTVVAWGVNSVIGETAVPAGLTNVVAIDAGSGHNLALLGDGTVVAWGENEFGQATVPAGLSNVVAVACGSFFSLALRNDGSLAGWGSGDNGPLSFPANLTNVVAISAGDQLTVALLGDGTVWALGAIGVGGGWVMVNFNDALTGPGDMVAVAGGGDAALGLNSDGTVTNFADAMAPPPGLGNVTAISDGWLAIAPNIPPQSFSQTATGPANRDLAITLGVLDANNDPLTLTVTAVPASGNLYQYGTNGARGTAITTAGTVVSDAAGRVIFVPATNSFGDPYASFNFKANDGTADSPEAAVTVRIIGTALAFTAPATRVRPMSAQLNGVVTPAGLLTTCWFDWGTNNSFGQTTSPTDAGSGINMIWLGSTITNLDVARVYHYRLVVSNIAGITRGAEQLMTAGGNVTDFLGTVPPGVSNVVGIARGYDHLAALRNDGTVIAWGGNGNGQTNVPASASNLVQVAAGNAFNLAVREDGSLTGWGLSANGQLSLPGGMNFVAVAAGAYHGLGLRSDGTVSGWGAVGSGLNLGQVTPPAGLSNVVAISAGVNHSLALKNDGTVVAWGNNYYGQISVPGDLTNVVAISAGSYHSLVLRADGTPITWGTWDFATIPLPAGLSNVVAIGAGYSLNVLLTSDGVVGAAGTYPANISVPAGLANVAAIATGNAYDALAIGNLPPSADSKSFSGPANRDVLTSLSGSDANGDPLGFRIVSLPAAGILYQYDSGGRGTVISSPGTVVSDPLGRLIFAPATNSFGTTAFQHVANDGQTDSPPATVNITIIGTPYAATLPQTFLSATNVILNGLAASGGLPALAWFDWGTNSAFGQMIGATALDTGLGSTPISATLAALASAGEYHFRLVVSNGTGVVYGGEKIFTTGRPVWAWGANNQGQGTVPDGLTNALAVAGGREFNLALLSDGTVAGWGRNDVGQASPPPGLSNVTAIAAGSVHSLALCNDGTVVAWGTNNFGQTNVPTGLVNVIAIAAGGYHSLALRNDGTVVAWGLNTSGQTNPPAGLSNVVAIAAGFSHSLALKLDGSVVSWGSQTSGPGVSNLIAIAAGGKHNLGLAGNGTVTAWGPSAPYGENNVPGSLSNVVAIAAGTNHSIALRRDGSIVFWGRNDLGQASSPAGLSNCLAVAGGDLHSLGLAPTNSVLLAATLAPTFIHATNAVLNGLVTPNGPGTVAWFEWGTNASFGRTTSVSAVSEGTALQPVSAALEGLKPYSAYHCRLVVSNAAGIIRGRDQLFTTGGRVRAWGGNSGGQSNVPPTLYNAVAVTAGTAHVVCLLNDGTVTAWGTNNSGQTTLPAGLTNIVAVAAGGAHSLALKADGRVVAWGTNNFGQTNVPVNLTNVIAIAAGDKHSLALKSDGTVVAWGYNSTNQATVPAGLSNVVAIAAASNSSVALRLDGIAIAWGSPATLAPNLNKVTAIAAGGADTIVLQQDGTVVVWGDNSYSQTNVPAGLSNAVGVALGDLHAIALKSDNTVTNWGSYYYGLNSVPAWFSNVVAVAAADSYNLVLIAGGFPPRAVTLSPTAMRPTSATLNGAVLLNDTTAYGWFQWGTNGSFSQTTDPVALTSTSLTARVSATLNTLLPGGIYSCRLVASNSIGVVYGREQRFTTGRKMLAWGSNSFGQTNIPPDLTNIVAVAAGQSHSIALKNDGTVGAWGYNNFNQTNVPANLTNAIAVAAGANHNLALRTNGTVTAWGANDTGQTNVPSSATNVVAIACGQYHSLALRADGKVIGWGNNAYRQTIVPSTLADVVAIAGGGRHSLALKSDGTVVAWGDNTTGQTNVPAGATNVIAIAAGDSFSLALKADSSAVAWGNISSIPPTATNLIAVAAGYNYCLTLKTNGTLLGWGDNGYGQSSAPAGASNFVALSAGMFHSLAIGPNRPPAAVPQTVSGLANHNLLLTLLASDPNGDMAGFRVTTLPAQGLLFQYTAGTSGDLISSNGTPVTDAGGRLFFVPAVNASGSPYASFMIVANDGEADSPTAQLTINIAPLVAPSFMNSTININTGGGFQFSYTGDSNTTYCVWASTNLSTWQYLGPGTPVAPGEFFYVDVAATNSPARFYRLTTDCQPLGP